MKIIPSYSASALALTSAIMRQETAAPRSKRKKVKSSNQATARTVINNTMQAVTAVARMFNTNISVGKILSGNAFILKNQSVPIKDAVNMINQLCKPVGFRAKFIGSASEQFVIRIENSLGITFIITGLTNQQNSKLIEEGSCALNV